MISAEDVVAAYPQAAGFDRDMLEHWVGIAAHAVPEARVKDRRTLAQAQALFVMHQMEKAPVDLSADWVRARVAVPRPGRQMPHPWAGTPHGESLIKAVKY